MHSTPYHVQKLDILIMYTLLDNYNIIEFNNPTPYTMGKQVSFKEKRGNIIFEFICKSAMKQNVDLSIPP